MGAFDILKDLLMFETSTGDELIVAQYVASFLEDQGVPVRVDYFGSSANVIAGDLNKNPELAVVAHIDTIPLERSVRISGESIEGRSVTDDLASVAVLMEVASSIEGAQFVFLAQEESTGLGSLRYLESYRPKYAIVMEPTNNEFLLKGHGVITFELIATGEGLHPDIAQVQKGFLGASERLIEDYLKIRELSKRIGLSLIILGMKAEYSEHLTPTEARMLLEINVPPEAPFLSFKGVLGIAKGIAKTISGRMKLLDLAPAFDSNILPHSKPFIEALEPKVDKAFPGRCDANNFFLKRIPVAVFGPGKTERIHTEKERIERRELEEASAILQGAIKRVLRAKKKEDREG